VDVGSSFLPSDLVAAFLLAQLGHAEEITAARLAVCAAYREAFTDLADDGLLSLPYIPPHCDANGHVFYVMLPDLATRERVQGALNRAGIRAVFHYVPLHDAPAGKKYARTHGALPHTQKAGDCLLRLPLWADLPLHHVAQIRQVVGDVLTGS